MIVTALALLVAQQPAATTAPSPTPTVRQRRAPRAAVAPQPPAENGAANPLPAAPRPRRAPRAANPDQAAVMAPINAMLRALETNDGAAILANTRPEGRATVALERDNGERGVRGRSWAEFAQLLRPGGERFTEHLYAPKVMIDGDVAMVWARYIVRRGRAIDHCGYDHFDVVREAGQWKVLNVTWSQRTTGCVTAPRASTPRPRRGSAAAAQ